MTRKKSIRVESNKNAGNGVPTNSFNGSSDFVNSSHNNSEKTKIILAAFVLLEIADAALTFFGISQRGLAFEKNLFVRNFVASFGFLPIAAIKIAASAAFAALINYSYEKLPACRKFLFYVSILLALIALYGVSSSVYVLAFYPW